MSIQLSVEVADDLPDTIKEPPPSQQLNCWAQAAWQGDENIQAEISLRIIGLAESQQLNADYRNKNKPTNVLSFPMELPAFSMHDDDFSDEILSENQSEVLGDLAICAEVVEQEAIEQNKSLTAHWAHMIVHGTLHLQGFDHIDDDEAEVMEQLEIKILQRLGYADPFQIIPLTPQKEPTQNE